MTTFTPTAEARLNTYLSQVRQALYANPDVSPDDVEADVREHIDSEFAGLNRPVTLGELDVVLARLGPPTQWSPAVSQATPPGVITFNWKGFVGGIRRRVKGVFQTLWKGPEDWRLAYITFGLTLLAPLTFGISLVVAFFFGRAAVELVKSRGESLGARRWLIYPPILAIVFPLLLLIAFTPAVAAGSAAAEFSHMARHWEHNNWQTETVVKEDAPPAKGERPLPAKYTRVVKPIPDTERASHERVLAFVRQMPGSGGFQEVVFVVFVFVGGLATWWTILGMLMWALPKWATTIFHPLLDGYDYLHGVRLAACGGLALVVWLGFAYRLWDAALIG